MSNARRPFRVRARLGIATGFLALFGTALVARAIDVQLVRSEFYQSEGDARFVREIPIATSRGMLTDRRGEPIAVSTPVESIWAEPSVALAARDMFPELAGALGVDPEALYQRLAQRAAREFVYLRRHMNPAEAEVILALGVPGIHSQREFRRFYPQANVMAHIVGFTNIDDHGQEGLELAFDDWLSGEPGAKRVIRDRRGAIVENVDLIRAAVPGRDLALSIDRRIQYLTHRELARAVQAHGAQAGTAVVLDVETGEIIAMANWPSYNPNTRGSGTSAARRNRAITDVFEPGSTMKAATVAAALETGAVTPTTMLETSPGTIVVGGHTIRDVHNYGRIDVTKLLTKSSNVGATRLALGMPDEQLHSMLERLGFGTVTGAGFPGESPGVLTAAAGWSDLEKATIAYGYGVSATALQLARMYAVLGNGGRRITPTFVAGGAQPAEQVIDPVVANALLTMLETVTGPEGTARRARVPGYRVAGKTGTSRKIGANGYERRYLSLFAGLVPVSKPRYAMAVMIDDPSHGEFYGGLVAAPVFATVMEGALRMADVPPDDVEHWYVAEPAAAESAPEGTLPLEAEAVAGLSSWPAARAP